VAIWKGNILTKYQRRLKMGTKTKKTPQIGEGKVRLTPKSQLKKAISPAEKETLVRPKGSKSYLEMVN